MNARRARERRRELRATLERARREPPRFLGQSFGLDWFTRGRAMFGIPPIPDAAPAELKNAIARRREASLRGRCECGAEQRPPEQRNRGDLLVLAMVHEHDCPASDEAIAEILARGER